MALKSKSNKKLVDGKYVVFLDQNLLHHTDFIREKVKLNIQKDKYYEQLNTLFEKIENQFGFRVVIAAHPRANIDEWQI